MEGSKSQREEVEAAYLKGLQVASELAEDHGVEWLKGYVVGVAAKQIHDIRTEREKETN